MGNGKVPAPITLADGAYPTSPPLSAELSIAPYRPKVSGSIAFFFGPFAGAFVVAISLRRMGHTGGARRVMLLALGLTVGLSALLFYIPMAYAKLAGLIAEIVFVLFFPVLMENEFKRWQAANPTSQPTNGWKAVGWGFLGVPAFLFVAVVTMSILSAFSPPR